MGFTSVIEKLPILRIHPTKKHGKCREPLRIAYLINVADIGRIFAIVDEARAMSWTCIAVREHRAGLHKDLSHVDDSDWWHRSPN